MTNLVWRFAAKDFIIQIRSTLNYLLVGIGLFAALSIMNISDKQVLFSMITFVIVYGFTNKALFEDEKNNTLRLLVSLPVKRNVIVYARYLSVFMIMITTVIVLFGLNALFPVKSSFTGASEANMAAIISIATVFIFMIILSIYLPLAFKLGYIKAANINRFVFVGIFAFFGAAGAIMGNMSKKGMPEFLKSADKLLEPVDANVLLILSVIVVLAIYLASMQLSARFFNRRNLF